MRANRNVLPVLAYILFYSFSYLFLCMCYWSPGRTSEHLRNAGTCFGGSLYSAFLSNAWLPEVQPVTKKQHSVTFSVPSKQITNESASGCTRMLAEQSMSASLAAQKVYGRYENDEGQSQYPRFAVTSWITFFLPCIYLPRSMAFPHLRSQSRRKFPLKRATERN